MTTVGRERSAWGAVFATMLDLVLPLRCASCGVLGEACCAACGSVFGRPWPVPRRRSLRGVGVYALAGYAEPARTLVLAYKERGRRDLAEPLGRALASGVASLGVGRELWLVPAPSRRAAARVRGGSHMVRLARSAAAALAASGVTVGVAPALRMAAGARDSVGLSAAARAANLAGRIRVDPDGLPPPAAEVVLLDDVVSTGATAAACTRVLKASGLAVSAVLALTATESHR